MLKSRCNCLFFCSMLGASLSNELKYKEQAFDEKIEKVFNLTEKVASLLSFDLFILLFHFINQWCIMLVWSFNVLWISQMSYDWFSQFIQKFVVGRSKFFIILVDFQVDSESVSAGKAAIGSLLGGIGYFYGQSKIALSRTLNVSYFSLWWPLLDSMPRSNII